MFHCSRRVACYAVGVSTPATPLQYEQSESNGAVIVRLAGELDVGFVEQLEKRFTELLESRPKMVVIDLAGAQMLSSVAMGAILRLHTALRASGGRMSLVTVPATVLAALRRARIDLLIPVHASVDAALAAKPAQPAPPAKPVPPRAGKS
jgi:anti-sigma B factor antagonist